MNKVYRKFSLVLSLLLFFSVFVSPPALASSSDIQNSWAAADINRMIEEGYLSGYPDGTFRPDQEMTRVQFIKVINKMFGFAEELDTPFNDIQASDWYYKDIRIAYKMGYIKGVSADKFDPNAVIKRQDVAVILARVLGLDDDASYCDNFTDKSQISDYAKGAVGAIAKAGIMIGYNDKTFSPNKNITRAEIVVAERANNYAKDHKESDGKTETPATNTDSSSKNNDSSKNDSSKSDKEVILSDAIFNGLTRIIVKTNRELTGINADKIIITKSSGSILTSDKITNIKQENGNLIVDLSADVFAKDSSKGTTISIKSFGDYSQSNAAAVGINGDTIAQVYDKITTSDPGNNSLWHNLGAATAIKANPTPIAKTKNGDVYNQIGDIRGLMIVVDFPDAKAENNTGVNVKKGETPKDYGNRINGHALQSAQDYYDWLMPRAKEFYLTASYGQLDLKVDLITNPNNPAGTYTCQNSLYGGLTTDEKGHTGYSFERNGDVDSYLKAVVPTAKNELMKAAGEYDIIYVVAVENAVGISYGPMDTWGGNANSWSGRTDLKAMVRIGNDTFTGWRTKAVNHETGHAIGAPDYYINAFSGPGSGQCDPVTGKADYYPYVGHWDLMGYINGPAPDMFSWMKWRLGWIRDDQVDIVDSDGTTTHQLCPVETPGGTKTVVVTSNEKGVFYVLENRQVAGVDNTSVTEKSTDPNATYQNDKWTHSYGTFNSPGILMYKIDANVPSLSGGISIVELKPEQTTSELASSLDKSVLGATSGIYEYTDSAAGVTVKLVNETGSINTVTVTKQTPNEKVKPVLSDAAFIDGNTIEFKTNEDLRGITADKIIIKNGENQVSGVKINQILPRRMRVTFDYGQFQEGEIAKITTDAFMYYGGSAEVQTSAFSADATPVLSEGKFNSVNEIELKSNVSLKGITGERIIITKKDGSIIPASGISTVVFDEATSKLKITLVSGQFAKYINTEGVKLKTEMFSDYKPADLNKEMAQFNPNVTVTRDGNEINVTAMDKGVMQSIEITSEPYKKYYAVGDTLNITGLKVVGTFSADGSTKAFDANDVAITGFDSSKAEENQPVTVTCEGKSDTFIVNITEKPQKIYVDLSSAHKKQYYDGEKFDISGLIVKGEFVTTGSSVTTSAIINVSVIDIIGFDSSYPVNNQTLTITYGDVNTTFDISIIAEPGEIMDEAAYYKFVNKKSTGLIDAWHGDYLVKWWDYATGPSDSVEFKFIDAGDYYYKIMSKSNNSYVAVSGDDLVLAPDSNDFSLMWKIQKVGDYYILRNRLNKFYITGNGNIDDSRILQTPHTGADDQLWKLTILEK